MYKPTKLDVQIQTLKAVAEHLTNGGGLSTMPLTINCGVCGGKPQNTKNLVSISECGVCLKCEGVKNV